MSTSIEILNRLGMVQSVERETFDEAMAFALSYSCQHNIELVSFIHQEREFTARAGAIFESTAP